MTGQTKKPDFDLCKIILPPFDRIVSLFCLLVLVLFLQIMQNAKQSFRVINDILEIRKQRVDNAVNAVTDHLNVNSNTKKLS